MTVDLRSSCDDRQRGQALVEFALVLMFVILPFIFVISDGAVMLFKYAMLTNGAREGARAGSIYQTSTQQSGTQSIDDYIRQIDAGRQTYILQEAQRSVGSLVSLSQCSNVITYTPAIPVLGVGNPYREFDPVHVRLECPHRLFFGLIGTSQITLSAQSSMRIEPGGVISPTIP